MLGIDSYIYFDNTYYCLKYLQISDVFVCSQNIRIGVVPAAGIGSRLNDLRMLKVISKHMVPILNKPILEYVLEHMKKLGVEKVFIIVGYKKDRIIEYFQDGSDFGVEIVYIEQLLPKGIAHAVSLVEKYVSEPFTVILGDEIVIADSLENLKSVFWEKNALAVEGIVVEDDIEILRQTCTVLIDDAGRIVDIEEKPEEIRSNIRGTGVYIFDPAVFDYIRRTPASPPRGEQEITNTLRLMAHEGKAYVAKIQGHHININNFEDLIRSTRLLLMRLDERGRASLKDG